MEPVIIEAGKAERHYWRDLWRFRELLGFLAWRDIKVRYKQAVLGAGWALVQPLVHTAIFTVVFGYFAKMPNGGVPYPVLVLSGLLPWQLFATALSGSSQSLVGNANLISKVYFPRMLVPLSSLAVSLVDFVIVLGLFTAVSIGFGHYPNWMWLILPLFISLALAAAFGVGLWLTALTVKYRDFRFIVPFVLQIGMFISPVAYRIDQFPNWNLILSFNPMTGVIDGFRWCLLGGDYAVNWSGLGIGIAIILGLNVTGLWYFRRTERSFADII